MVDRVSPNWRRTVAYTVQVRRPRPVPGRAADADRRRPVRAVETSRTFTRSQHLLVTPQVHRAARRPARRADRAGSGENRPRAIASAGEDDATVREYRDGDDLRRVHWRSTARRGELMVRREEQPWQSRCALLLDTRTISHHGDGPSSSLEWAVSAAASVGVRPDPPRLRDHPARRADHAVGDQPPHVGRRPPAAHPQQLLTECATVEEHKYAEIGPLLTVDRHDAGAEPGDRDRRRLQLRGHHLAEPLADQPGDRGRAAARRGSWAVGAEATEKAARLTAAADATENELRRNGWRVARVRRGDHLPTVWSGLGLRSGRIA